MPDKIEGIIQFHRFARLVSGIYERNQVLVHERTVVDGQMAGIVVRVEVMVRDVPDALPESVPADLVTGKDKVSEVILHHFKGNVYRGWHRYNVLFPVAVIETPSMRVPA